MQIYLFEMLGALKELRDTSPLLCRVIHNRSLDHPAARSFALTFGTLLDFLTSSPAQSMLNLSSRVLNPPYSLCTLLDFSRMRYVLHDYAAEVLKSMYLHICTYPYGIRNAGKSLKYYVGFNPDATQQHGFVKPNSTSRRAIPTWR
jgi:hypothetical protein